eukprot:Protomagalhaensia_sp_Gyna_25__479@NODE_1226_length_2048_cov_19_492782_g977_i0_p2_GENE_NODE_1226_length_2048_cov_19_492782_g977_i0NODE_1226_length_2048_cov_19_492782_g977_i0_p2_ORF_typecomplete_len115_score7_08DUF4838/PF16126_5/0_033NUC130_3NT/PF08158_12/2_8NUC130_3NT/PF08158_12/81_NODE_1226_length_2048_cov_19_492782_g977_i012531597
MGTVPSRSQATSQHQTWQPPNTTQLHQTTSSQLVRHRRWSLTRHNQLNEFTQRLSSWNNQQGSVLHSAFHQSFITILTKVPWLSLLSHSSPQLVPGTRHQNLNRLRNLGATAIP